MPPAVRRRPRRPATALGLVLLLAGSGACASDADPAPGPRRGAPASPAAGPDAATPPFWVDPNSPAARQVAAWEAQGRNSDAQLLRRISERPGALWAPGGDPRPAVRRAASAARAAGRTLVVAAYNIPHRAVPHPSCADRPTGGARDAGAYRAWIGSLADALAGARALVVLEPGAVAHLVDGCAGPGPREERYRLLAEAVERLKRDPGTRVYLDAGHADWIRDPDDLVEPLRRSGLERADGFALNVAGFRPDAEVREYGARLSRALGGRHFVVDTGRNGAGPPPESAESPEATTDRSWCNPPGRALGTPPTDRTGDPLVDAYLWVRPPGASDGTCRGGPEAGVWWPDHALGLARRARE
ncbi:glycoside hydrolase family 6 protein [Streptomyces sp. NPDC048606]|uniref:glycoside hydrolase family 6 protein n=1 Tax=Streptomyces sp. NPDC048606 TaxID=3154726 RepID=UPI0034365DEC